VPHHKSASKRLRQAEVRRQRNVHFRSNMRTAIKKVRAALDAGDVPKAQTLLAEATQIIDTTRSHGVIHARTASRKIGRLTRAVNAKTS